MWPFYVMNLGFQNLSDLTATDLSAITMRTIVLL